MKTERAGCTALIALLMAPIGMTGCGDNGRSRSTPQEALRAALTAMANLDRDGFVGSLSGSPDELRAAGAMIDFIRAGRDFEQKFVQTYGQSAWEAFQDRQGARLSTTLEADLSKLEQVQYKVEGDTATCSMPGETRVVHVVRKDGRWRVKVGDLMQFKGDPAKSATLWTKIAEAIESGKQKIGQPGVTGEQLDNELGRELMLIITGRG